MADHAATEDRIAQSRDRLAAKLAELQSRVTHVKTLVSPRTYLENPWVQLGLGAAVGFLIGRVPASRRLMPGDPVHEPARAAGSPGIFGSALRSALIGIAASVMKRAITEVLRSVDAEHGAGATPSEQKPTP